MGRLIEDDQSKDSSPHAAVSFAAMWWRGAILAFYLFGLFVLVGSGFRVLEIVAGAIPYDGFLPRAFVVAVVLAYFFLLVPLVCYGFGISVHQWFIKWQSRDVHRRPTPSSDANRDDL